MTQRTRDTIQTTITVGCYGLTAIAFAATAWLVLAGPDFLFGSVVALDRIS